MPNPYNKYVIPRLTEWICGSRNLEKERLKVVPKAHGVVLEIGMGTGHNLAYYDPEKVKKLYGLEPSGEALKYAQKRISLSPFEVQAIHSNIEGSNLPSESIDSILFTFTLCSIRNLNESLNEMKRVLRPGGKILFCEHGISKDESVSRFQNAINPLWKQFSGGCNLNRNIPKIISSTFKINNMEQGYSEGVKFASYHYWGEAEKK